MQAVHVSPEGVSPVREPIARMDALFGPDGTQLPDPLPVFPDALTGPAAVARDQDRGEPLLLPPAPDAGAIQEAIAAALADDPVPAPPRRRPPPPSPAPVRMSASRRTPGPRPPAPVPPMAGLERMPPPIPYRTSGAGRPRQVDPAPAGRYRRARPERSSRRNTGIGCVVVLIVLALMVFNLLAQLLAGPS